jgi:hypothetical protein
MSVMRRDGNVEHAVVAPTLVPMAMAGSWGLSKVQCVKLASIVCRCLPWLCLRATTAFIESRVGPLTPLRIHLSKPCMDELGVERHGIVATRKLRIYGFDTNC